MQWHWKWLICMHSIVNGYFTKSFKNLSLYETGQKIPVEMITIFIHLNLSGFYFIQRKLKNLKTFNGNHRCYRVYGVLSDV